jgi:hypothetical protein
MLPTVEEFNKSSASNYEKGFFKMCLERKIHDWRGYHSLSGFRLAPQIKVERCPQDLTIDIIYKGEEEDE